MPPDPTPLHPHLRPIVPVLRSLLAVPLSSGTRLKTDTRVGTDAALSPALPRRRRAGRCLARAGAEQVDARVGAADARAADRRERLPSPKRPACRTLQPLPNAPPQPRRHLSAPGLPIAAVATRAEPTVASRRMARRGDHRRSRLADAEQRAHAFARAEYASAMYAAPCAGRTNWIDAKRLPGSRRGRGRFAREGRLELRRAQLGDADERTHRRRRWQARGGGGVQAGKRRPRRHERRDRAAGTTSRKSPTGASRLITLTANAAAALRYLTAASPPSLSPQVVNAVAAAPARRRSPCRRDRSPGRGSDPTDHPPEDRRRRPARRRGDDRDRLADVGRDEGEAPAYAPMGAEAEAAERAAPWVKPRPHSPRR